jgi:TonB family protein
MTAASFVRDLAAFWVQIAFVAAVLAALLKVVSIPARTRYVCLRLALIACLVVPWTLRSAAVITPIAVADRAANAIAPLAAGPLDGLTPAPPQPTAASSHVIPDIPWTTLVLVALVAGVVARGLWLAVGVIRLGRLRRRAMQVDAPDYAAAQEQLGTAATIAQVEGLPQPVTFGFRRPIVLLPETLATAPAALRRAVITHELFHVRRGDWLSVLGEEALRTVLWFHPAILWLTSHIQLAREEIVDELTVRATGDRRTYMQALLAFADTGGLRPAPAFAYRRQLFHRILSVSKERVMSAPRIVMSIGVLAAAICGASWYASTVFPIVAAAPVETPAAAPMASVQESVQRVAGDIVATGRVVEAAAVTAGQGTARSAAQTTPYRVTPENPIPRRTRGVLPTWPSQFLGDRCQLTAACGYHISVSALVALDRNGAITSVVSNGCSLSDGAVCRAYFDTSATAIRQWRYDRPVQAPLEFNVVVTFREGKAEPEIVQSGVDWMAYVREAQESLRVLAELTGGTAVANRTDDPFLQTRIAEVMRKLREVEQAQRVAAEQLNPEHPEMIKLQREIATLNAQLAAVQERLRSAEVARAEADRAAARLRVAQQALEARQGPGAVTSTVNPTPSSPFDGSRQLVSPSGRAPVRVGGPIASPGVIKSAKPTYSQVAMEARVEGTVTVEVLVDERGHVAGARVLKSIPLLDESALNAARQWEFTPTLVNGEPVPVLLMLEINFALR